MLLCHRLLLFIHWTLLAQPFRITIRHRVLKAYNLPQNATHNSRLRPSLMSHTHKLHVLPLTDKKERFDVNQSIDLLQYVTECYWLVSRSYCLCHIEVVLATSLCCIKWSCSFLTNSTL